MELMFFAVAFGCGFILQQCKLPPLIGFLIAGFALKFAGYSSTPLLEDIAAVGVTLLLFSIGLKLKVENLLKIHVWAPASLHIVISCAFFSIISMLFASFGLPLFIDLSWQTAALIGFAFSFSSTVFAVKVLEQRGEMNSLHGKVSIGILVMQDIFAVIFLAISTGKVPNYWAIGLVLLLPLIRPLFFMILDRSKHGELLPLFGFFFALVVGYQAFEFSGLKGDLGALIIGMLFAKHAKAGELAKSLLSFKDLMLIGFFLSIGLNAHLSIEALAISLLFVLLLPAKVLFYYLCTNGFKLRARTSLLSAFTLSNYSEFGLIVCALAATNQWLSPQWLAVIALAVSFTFVLASPLNSFANEIYVRIEHFLLRYEPRHLLPEEQSVDLGEAKILIFGMGRIGTGAYDEIAEDFGGLVTGVDISLESVSKHVAKGRKVIAGDATDPDFWQRINYSKVETIMLSMPKHIQNLLALEQLQAAGFKGKVTAIANHQDQQQELDEMGIDSTYNFYLEAGAGFAEHVKERL